MSTKITGVTVDLNDSENFGYNRVTHTQGARWSIEDGYLYVADDKGAGIAAYAFGTWRSVQYAFADVTA